MKRSALHRMKTLMSATQRHRATAAGAHRHHCLQHQVQRRRQRGPRTAAHHDALVSTGNLVFNRFSSSLAAVYRPHTASAAHGPSMHLHPLEMTACSTAPYIWGTNYIFPVVVLP